jgi:hypothetical protein
MPASRISRALAFAGLALLAPATALAQQPAPYPSQAIKFVAATVPALHRTSRVRCSTCKLGWT